MIIRSKAIFCLAVFAGSFLGESPNPPEARVWYEKALQLDPANADTWVARGALACRRSRIPVALQIVDQGISDLKRALALDPHQQNAMMFLDALYRQRGPGVAANSNDRGVGGWYFRHVPRPDGLPPPMLVNPMAQERNLIRKVEPAYLSPASGTLRLAIIIGKDGNVREVALIEGDPLLADAAVKAVRQWVYRPTVSNWEPVEVLSEVLLQPADLQ